MYKRQHKEIDNTNNHYNCPIVTSYAENIKNNVEELKTENIDFRNPFLSFESEEILAKRLKAEFPLIPAPEIKAAVHDLSLIHISWQMEVSALTSYIIMVHQQILPLFLLLCMINPKATPQ